MNKVVINGKEIQCSGNNVVVADGKVIVGEKVINTYQNSVEIKVYGDVMHLEANGSVIVDGNVGSIDCDENCYVSGSVLGDIYTDENVNCGSVLGTINAGWSVMCK